MSAGTKQICGFRYWQMFASVLDAKSPRRGGLPRQPVESIVDLHYRLHLSLTNQAQKKRPMLCIVVSRLPALFEQLMFLYYQIGLDFASGVGL